MNFDRIKKNYDSRLWDERMVALAVVKGVITAMQYKSITGKDYEKEEADGN